MQMHNSLWREAASPVFPPMFEFLAVAFLNV